MEANQTKQKKRHVTVRIVICTLILVIGWAGMTVLASLKKPPAEAETQERAIKVRAMAAAPQDHAVVITGYGQATALTVVSVAAEVSGRVVHTHPSLKVGEIIPAGEVMFRIDPADYEANLKEARAGVTQWQNTVARLKKQFAIDTQRLKTLERNANLAQAEFDRIRRLFEKDRVGTRSGVDQAERAYNSAVDQADQMSQAVTLSPMQIREAESNLAAAAARLSLAQTSLSRCTDMAPFDARIKSAAIETSQYVVPGQRVVTLADDTILEIQVALDSRDARRWLQFEAPAGQRSATTWFTNLKPVACTIRWTEDKANTAWIGTLHRVVQFEQQTRTLTVAVRIRADTITHQKNGALPLVEGMFCSVDIPGRTMTAVYRLPRQAVSFENKAYLVGTDNRLKTVTVAVERIEGEFVYVSQGLHPGDTVVLTRLIDPLENALLEVAASEQESAS